MFETTFAGAKNSAVTALASELLDWRLLRYLQARDMVYDMPEDTSLAEVAEDTASGPVAPTKSLPTAFQDWANTKAAYRFFANDNVSEDKILAGHFAASGLRVRTTDGPILVLQDTTEFSFKRAAPEKIGFTKTSCGRKGKEGRHSQHMICGMLMHASLAVTPEGLPLGLTAAKFWSREKFKGTKALARKVNPTRVPIEQKESMRWLDNPMTKLVGN